MLIDKPPTHPPTYPPTHPPTPDCPLVVLANRDPEAYMLMDMNEIMAMQPTHPPTHSIYLPTHPPTYSRLPPRRPRQPRPGGLHADGHE